MFLLDTNVVSEPLKRRPRPGVRDRFLRLTVEIPEAVFKWLRKTARKRRLSEAEIARETLAAAAKGKVPTLGELMADLAGTGRGRRTDLSTNKDALADFGQ